MKFTASLLALLAMLVASAFRAPARRHSASSDTYEDVYYLPPPSWLPVLSLGYQSALLDLLWIRALVYVGDEFGHAGAMRYVFDYTESMLVLEPDFEPTYHWIASAGLYQTADITRDDLLRTIRLLERGVERLPDSGQLQWDLGATLAFEVGPYAKSDGERDDWRLQGIEHLMIATRLGAAPPWMVLSSASMLTRIGANERAVEHMEEMYATLDDPETRAVLAERIAAIRGETYSTAFVDASEAAEVERRENLPYGHPHLYFLLGPPPDIDASLRDGFAAHAFDDEIVLREPD